MFCEMCVCSSLSVFICVCVGSCADKPVLILWPPRASQGEDVDVELAVSAASLSFFFSHCLSLSLTFSHTHTHTCSHTSTSTQCLFCKCEAPGGWISASYPVCDLSFNTTEPGLKNNQSKPPTTSVTTHMQYTYNTKRSKMLHMLGFYKETSESSFHSIH